MASEPPNPNPENTMTNPPTPSNGPPTSPSSNAVVKTSDTPDAAITTSSAHDVTAATPDARDATAPTSATRDAAAATHEAPTATAEVIPMATHRAALDRHAPRAASAGRGEPMRWTALAKDHPDRSHEKAAGSSVRLKRGDEVELCTALLRTLASELPPHVVAVGTAWYAYDVTTGIWKEVPRAKLSVRVQRFAGLTVAGEKPRPLRLGSSTVNGVLTLAADRASRPDFFDAPKSGLAFADGFACIVDGAVALVPHDPSHRCRAFVPAKYTTEPPMRCLAFLRERFRTFANPDEAVELVFGFLGACLLGVACRFQRALFLCGPGHNGKSTIADIARGIVPAGLHVALSPDQVAHEYGREMLRGALLNACTELPASIHDPSFWKAAVVGDEVTARAIRQRPVKFRPIAGHLFAANHLPSCVDQSDGFFRRLVLLHLGGAIPPERIDLYFAQRLLDEERSAITCEALRAGARALARGGYVIPKECAVNEIAWRTEVDVVGRFVKECLEVVEHGDGSFAQPLYASFRNWLQAVGEKPIPQRTFARRLRELNHTPVEVGKGTRYPLRLLPNDDGDAEERSR